MYIYTASIHTKYKNSEILLSLPGFVLRAHDILRSIIAFPLDCLIPEEQKY